MEVVLETVVEVGLEIVVVAVLGTAAVEEVVDLLGTAVGVVLGTVVVAGEVDLLGTVVEEAVLGTAVVPGTVAEAAPEIAAGAVLETEAVEEEEEGGPVGTAVVVDTVAD